MEKKEIEFLEFALSNTVDPINVIHLTGRIKSLKNRQSLRERAELNQVRERSGVTVSP